MVSLLHDFLRAVKQASLDAVNSTQPSAPFVGTVASASPLTIKLDQRLILTQPNLILMESAVGLAEGDKVALIRFSGGQQFLVLGKLE